MLICQMLAVLLSVVVVVHVIYLGIRTPLKIGVSDIKPVQQKHASRTSRCCFQDEHMSACTSPQDQAQGCVCKASPKQLRTKPPD